MMCCMPVWVQAFIGIVLGINTVASILFLITYHTIPTMTNRDRPELFIRVVMAWIAIVFIGIGAMVYSHKPEVRPTTVGDVVNGAPFPKPMPSAVYIHLDNVTLVAYDFIDLRKPICELKSRLDTVIADGDTTIYYIISSK